ncbi:hypothetical protein P6008_17130 [Ectobacillus antri]|nr:hypothetical protein [Ectobacillus antri]MDG4658565.1 hypothetical protein [Ectobacillus antri]
MLKFSASVNIKVLINESFRSLKRIKEGRSAHMIKQVRKRMLKAILAGLIVIATITTIAIGNVHFKERVSKLTQTAP